MLDYRTQKIDYPVADTIATTPSSLAARVEQSCDHELRRLRAGSAKMTRLRALLASEKVGRACATSLILQVRLAAAQKDLATQKGPDLRPALL